MDVQIISEALISWILSLIWDDTRLKFEDNLSSNLAGSVQKLKYRGDIIKKKKRRLVATIGKTSGIVIEIMIKKRLE